MAAILEIYFALLLNRKANLLETWEEVSGWVVEQYWLNLFWSEIQDDHHLENLILNFFWTERPIDWKIDRKYQGDL